MFEQITEHANRLRSLLKPIASLEGSDRARFLEVASALEKCAKGYETIRRRVSSLEGEIRFLKFGSPFAGKEHGMIDGLEIKKLSPLPDERGRLMEIIRKSDPMSDDFQQVYMTTAYPGVVKAWHRHRLQIDHVTCIFGMVKLVLYDGRVNSDTHREIVELFIGEANPLLVRIPSWVWHGFKNIGIKEAIVLNAPSVEYNASSPDEDRLLPSCDDIPYNWGREDK